MNALLMPRPDPGPLQRMRMSLLKALRKVTSGPAQLTLYALAAGALALSVGTPLPPVLAVLASSVGANALYDILKKVAEGQDGDTEALETQLHRVALELKTRDFLEDDAQQRAIGGLIRDTALLKQAVEHAEYATLVAISHQSEGHAVLIQALHSDLVYISDFLTRILAQQAEQATRDQVEKLDRRLENLLGALQEQVTRSTQPRPAQGPVRVLWIHESETRDPGIDRIQAALHAHGFALLEPALHVSEPFPHRVENWRSVLGSADRVLIVLDELRVLSETTRDALADALAACKPVTVVWRGQEPLAFPPDVERVERVIFRTGQDEAMPLADLIQRLSAPPTIVGRLLEVPALPPRRLPRPAELAHLHALIIERRGRTTSYQTSHITLLEGMGGIGKSFLAAAFAQACPTRTAFPDGIIWISVGQQPNQGHLYQRIGVALGDNPANYPTDEGTCRVRIQNTLRGKRCLLILDDLWDLPTGRAFQDLVVGTDTDLLITTRNLKIREALGAAACRVDLLDQVQSIDLLQVLTGRLDPGYADVAEALGGLPLALKLAGARMAKEGLTAAAFRARFDRVSRLYTDRRAMERKDRQESLTVSILLGVEAVFGPDQSDVALFDSLGIFPEDTRVPEETVLRLWGHVRPERTAFERHDILLDLADLALIERHDDRTISLHDILHAYTREQLGDRHTATQALLLTAHRPASGWRDLSDDEPYLWDHLAYHLTEAGLGDELALTAVDFLYLARKCRLRSAFAAEADLAAARALNPTDRAVEGLQRRFSQSFAWINRAAQTSDVSATDLAGLLHIQTVHVPGLANSRQALERQAPGSFIGGWRLLPNLPDSHLIRTLPGHASRVLSVALHPSRGVIISASSKGGLVAWSLTGERLRAFSAHPGAMYDVALDAGARTIYTAAADGQVRAWDLASGHLQYATTIPCVRALAVPHVGGVLYAGAADGRIHCLDAQTGRVRSHFAGHEGAILDLACSTDGATIASASNDQTVKLWDVSTGALRVTLHGHTRHVWSVALDARANIVVSGSADGSVRVWDAQTGERHRTLLGHADAVQSVALTADGQTVISASADKTIMIWDWKSGRCLATLEGHHSSVRSLAIGMDSDIAISGSDDGTIKVWDLASARNPDRPSVAQPRAAGLPRAPIRDVIAVSAETGAVVCRAAIGNQDRLRIIPGDPTTDEITVDDWSGLTMSGDGTLVAVSVPHTRETQHSEDATDYIPTLWSTGSSHSDSGCPWPRYYRPSLTLDRSGKVLVACSSQYAILAWDTQTWAEIFRLNNQEVHRHVYNLSPDGTSLVTASEDIQTEVWDLTSGRIRFAYQDVAHTTSVVVSDDHAHIVCGTSEGFVHVRDGRTGRLEATWRVSEFPIGMVRLDRSGRRILSVAGGGSESPYSEVKIWALSTSQCLGTFVADAEITCCDWAPDGCHFLLGGTNGVYSLQVLGERGIPFL